MHREMGLPETRLDRARVAGAWLWQLTRRRLRDAAGPLRPPAAVASLTPQQLNSPHRGTIRAMARRLDVDLDAIASRNHWMAPHVYTHAPVMSFTARELELDQRSQPGVRHVGPVIDADRFEPPLDAETDGLLEALLDRCRSSSQRLAYCSMGSLLPANRVYYQRVIDAFAQAPEWELVLGLGGRGGAVELAIPDRGVLVLDHAPQLRVLDGADVAIHPGGTGTFYECLYFGVPSIVMHTGDVDKAGVAARIEHFDLGVSRDPASVTSVELFRDAQRLAAEPWDGARAQLTDTLGSSDAAAEFVEAQLLP